jgi:hypothetical protein
MSGFGGNPSETYVVRIELEKTSAGKKLASLHGRVGLVKPTFGNRYVEA